MNILADNNSLPFFYNTKDLILTFPLPQKLRKKYQQLKAWDYDSRKRPVWVIYQGATYQFENLKDRLQIYLKDVENKVMYTLIKSCESFYTAVKG